jgi:hypothetical protein
MAFQGALTLLRTRQRPRYGLNFGRDLRKRTVGGVPLQQHKADAIRRRRGSSLLPTNFASFCKNSLRQIPVTRWRWRGSCRCA